MSATLEQLELRILALEDGAGGADQLNPNVLTVNPDGTIGANLTGHLHAAGVDLDAAGDAIGTSANHVRWIRLSDGSVVADIVGWTGAAASHLVLESRATTPDITLTDVEVTVGDIYNGTKNRTILDSQGRSAFLQLGPTHLDSLSQVGTTAVTWPGGLAGLAAPTIVLPFTPAGAVATALDTNAAGQVLVTAQVAANALNLFLTELPSGALVPAGTVTRVAWLAWA